MFLVNSHGKLAMVASSWKIYRMIRHISSPLNVWNGGTQKTIGKQWENPNSWLVFVREDTNLKMDDDWGYRYDLGNPHMRVYIYTYV